MECIAIDIGNGYVKAVNEKGKELHFPTVLKESKDRKILGEVKGNYSIKVDDVEYYIGNLAIAKRAERRWEPSKKVNADTLLYVALCSHLLTEEKKINLCLGLPYSYYVGLNKGEELIHNLTNKIIKTNYKDQKRTIEINHVSVYPQGVGAYFLNLYEIDGTPKGGAEEYIKSLFIDIGYRTVDIVAFDVVDNYFQLIEENSLSLEELGTYQIANYISKLIDVEYSVNEIEYALRNNSSRIENMYGVIDLKDLETEAYKELAERIAMAISLKLSGQIQKYGHIFLTGGGAEKLYPLLKKSYVNLKLQEDHIFCNAKGYLALENTK